MGVVYKNAPVGSGPDATLAVFIKTTDKITSDADGIFGIVAENFKTVSIEPVQSVDRSKPEKSVLVEQTANNTVVGQTALYTVMFKIILLGMNRGN